MTEKVRIRYVSWRDGRPRFEPGLHLRERGEKGFDLKHADGAWFSEIEARQWAAEKHQALSAARAVRSTPTLLKGAGYIYFLRADRLMKVGFSRNPFTRASALRTGIGAGLSSIIAVPGSRADEAAIHRVLRADRSSGEWFKMTPLAEEIALRSARAGKIVIPATDFRKPVGRPTFLSDDVGRVPVSSLKSPAVCE